jgi:hypothetical protein
MQCTFYFRWHQHFNWRDGSTISGEEVMENHWTPNSGYLQQTGQNLPPTHFPNASLQYCSYNILISHRRRLWQTKVTVAIWLNTVMSEYSLLHIYVLFVTQAKVPWNGFIPLPCHELIRSASCRCIKTAIANDINSLLLNTVNRWHHTWCTRCVQKVPEIHL